MKNIPEHIAIIMDGNGRWAKSHGLPRSAGHSKGVKTLRKIIKYSQEIGLKYLSVYAFSTENWKRNEKEITFLMGLLKESIKTEIENSAQNNPIKIMFIGRITELDLELQKNIAEAESISKDKLGLQVNIMLNYGGRAEIVDAVNSIIEDRDLKKVDEKVFAQYLYTDDIPDPELLIRTSGEIRISNYMLWQIAYSEIWITPKMWPEFQEDDLMEAIKDYQKRQRRFGAL